ncbi:hypothetical protein ABVK25_002064 [Lepraria finkii]|uniref:Uncharacterized protein n=1 Tax=Lepraria finkii TaxID=1340010 RepID=A0ABR4BIM9_9LECA
MFYGISALAFVLPPCLASAVLPQPTAYAKITTPTSVRASKTTDCLVQCTRDLKALSTVSWQQKFITTTITAETLLFIVNKRTNSTRTSTVTNTEVDLRSYTPLTNTNSAGTRTTSFVLTNDNGVSTHTLAFPTMYYGDYPSSYTICGTLPTAVSGASTCLKHACSGPLYFDASAPTFMYPSHPSLPEATRKIDNVAGDPKGLTWEAVWTSDGTDFTEKLQPLVPGLGVWNCTAGEAKIEEPDSVKEDTLYLTATSTSTEADDELTTLARLAASQPMISKTTTTKVEPTQTSTSHRSMSEAATTEPEPTQLNTPDMHDTSSYSSSAATLALLAPPNDAATVTTTASKAVNSYDQQGSITSATPQLPGIVLTSTNARDSQITTTPLVKSTSKASKVAAPISVDGQKVSTNANSQSLVSWQILIPGHPVTLGSDSTAIPILLQTSSSHAVVIIGSGTTILHAAPTAASSSSISHTSAITKSRTSSIPGIIAILPPLNIGTQTISVNSQNQYIVGDQTLTPGGVITASGTTFSLASSPTQLVVGTTTEGFGWYTMSGLGAGPSTSASKTGVSLTGAAHGGWKCLLRSPSWLMGLMALVVWL